jgi:endonuclease/exonuclease/phosphatase family metal-dependent hydrolase
VVAVTRIVPALLLVLAACTAPAANEPGPLAVRLMTFNLRWDGFDDGRNGWRHRRELVYRVLREFRPDSVGTQEPMIRQVSDIETAIPTLASYRFDNHPRYVRTQQILYRRDRFERVDAGGFLIAEGTNEEGSVRYCTWVRLADKATGRRYYHYNVHLDHRDPISRQLSVVRLMKHIDSRGSDDPFVITGDFNDGEDSPTMAFLRGERELADEQGVPYANPIPLVDTYRVLCPDAPDSGTSGGFRGHRGSRKIDHVLVAAGAATIHTAEIVHTSGNGRYPSDHFPVTAVVEWK